MDIVGMRVVSPPHTAINGRLPRVKERVGCAECLNEESHGNLYLQQAYIGVALVGSSGHALSNGTEGWMCCARFVPYPHARMVADMPARQYMAR
jgi:hypothetical protein